MNVLHLRVPELGAVAIRRIVRQQLGVMFQMRTAAARVGNDGVELFRRKLIDVVARQFLGQFPFAVVGVKRAAAILLRRRDDFAAIARQHFDGVAIDIAEDQVLRATGQHGHAIALLADGRGDRRDQLGRKLAAESSASWLPVPAAVCGNSFSTPLRRMSVCKPSR